jgi:hypothetical protein
MNRPYAGRYLSFPFDIGPDGRTATAPDLHAHVRDELLQLILTTIGERAFQTEIGTNVRRLVFENLDEVTAGVTKSTVVQAIDRWLGHRVEIDDLRVEVDPGAAGMITVEICYRIAGTDDTRVLKFQRSGE